MSDLNAGKYHRMFQEEFRIAQLVLEPHGGLLAWSTNDYEAFRYTGQSVTLLFYPHKTSAQNRHVRVRDQGSKDKAKAAELMARLRIGSGHFCTFSQKNQHDIMGESEIAKREGLQYGWARNAVSAKAPA